MLFIYLIAITSLPGHVRGLDRRGALLRDILLSCKSDVRFYITWEVSLMRESSVANSGGSSSEERLFHDVQALLRLIEVVLTQDSIERDVEVCLAIVYH